MSYQVFARKYRPQTFDDILGQDHVVQTLRNAIEQNRLAHAYLFVGPRGTGKTSTARILAKALNCTEGPKVDFDPEEDICREIAEGNSLDVLEIDGASNNGVEQVRELRETVKFAPARGQFKIYYIDEVHMLTTQAFNALLKTLEEPPPHVKFIFATTEPTRILPTIISRCQRFDLRRIPEKIIASHLLYIAKNEGVTLDRMAASAIAKGAEGGMRDAQSMLDQLVAFCGNEIKEADVLEIFGFTGFETVAALSGHILAGETAEALNRLHEQSELGKDLTKLLADLIAHFRNLLVYKVDPDGAAEEFAADIVKSLEAQSALVETERLLNLIDNFAETDGRMKWAPNKRLHFEVGIIRAVQSLSESSISDVIGLIDGALSGAPPVSPATASAPAKKKSSRAAKTVTEEAPAAASMKPESSPKPEPEAAAPPSPSSAADGQELSGDSLWRELAVEVDQQRPLASAWLRAGHFQRQEGKYFVLAFSPDDDFARDSLIRPNNKGFIEGILKKLSGQNLTLKLETGEDLPASSAPAEPGEIPAQPIESEPEPAPPPLEQPERESLPAAAKAAPKPAPAAEKKAGRKDDFHEDPLIQDALEVFEAEIKQST